jgi:hypothetical protein
MLCIYSDSPVLRIFGGGGGALNLNMKPRGRKFIAAIIGLGSLKLFLSWRKL